MKLYLIIVLLMTGLFIGYRAMRADMKVSATLTQLIIAIGVSSLFYYYVFMFIQDKLK